MYHANANVNLVVDNVIEIKGEIMINVDATCKKNHICEKDYIWNPATCSWESVKYLASIIDNSVIKGDKIIDAKEKKTISKDIICEIPFINYFSIIDSF